MVFYVDGRLMQPGTSYLQDKVLAFLNENFPAKWKYAEITRNNAPDKSYVYQTLENSAK
jgi:predicted transcriptional regulator with HTH domain